MLCSMTIFLIPAFQESGSIYENPSASKSISTKINVFIAEEFDEEWEHENYQQAYPVIHSVQHDGPQGRSTSRISYFTRCRFRPEDPEPRLTPVTSPGLTTLFGGELSWRRLDVARKLFPVTTGFPRSDPPVTKSGLPEGYSEGVRDSDRPLLCGPSLDLLLSRNVEAWEPARWLPESTALHLYARALFGRFEVYDVESSLEQYSVGLRLAVPLLEVSPFSLGAEVSSGPGFMRTDIGDAVGLESGVGIRALVSLFGGVSLRCSANASLFVSEDLYSWGPGAHVGFDIPW